MGCHIDGLEFHCTHWMIDLIGIACLVFWTAILFGILYLGLFGLRPKRFLGSVTGSHSTRSETPKKPKSKSRSSSRSKRN
ncbi:unnamed protein product [Cylicocyclus nassatus]|uniref:Uncharacterized protein n=1 Tax=Cylicocyclus nassatus TaxID=53992 RepID=A0AA36GLA8_CYLNA|nr:unnamed protein product [Cylicocyclus nassatus]